MINGHVYMLDDQRFCTAECRLQACRASAGKECDSPTALVERPHLLRSSSMLSRGSSTGSGLYASFQAWL